ncbi:MAG: preprotein translocase subunit SecE [Acidobacteria bacterium]|nr:preprotein translocase subunit SecE [Acidobacteriota bacterium]MBI1982873.1 preprotein translocase subunit SecE [Acidobacteriota bacterium]
MAEELGISKNAFNRMRDYFADVRTEMKRVTWPGKQEVYGTTVMVIITTFVFAFYFGICDYLFRFGVQNVLDYFLGGR